MKEITGNLKRDVKDLLGESASLATGLFKRGLCTVRAVAEKWKAFAHDIGGAMENLMKPPFLEDGREAPAQILDAEAQPIVTVTESIEAHLPVGRQMTLSQANEEVRRLDEQCRDAELTPQAVKLRIDYMMDGQTDRYWLPVQIGAGGSLLEQMENHISAYRTDAAKLEQVFEGVAPEYREELRAQFAPHIQAGLDQLATKLVSFFQRHCDIAIMETQFDAQALLMPEKEQKAFRQSTQKAVTILRRAANTGAMPRAGDEYSRQPPENRAQEKPRQSVKVALRQIKGTGQQKKSGKVRLSPER